MTHLDLLSSMTHASEQEADMNGQLREPQRYQMRRNCAKSLTHMVALAIFGLVIVLPPAHAFLPIPCRGLVRMMSVASDRPPAEASWASTEGALRIASLKQRLLQLGAQTDRGKLQDPLITEDGLYKRERQLAIGIADQLAVAQRMGESRLDATLLEGSWELVYATAQLFRSSPFFLAIEAAYNDSSKSELFFKLHELQTCSWGASQIGRVAQNISLASSTLVSEFDTVLFPVTAIPIVGFWKLLPTFGGRIISWADQLQVEERADGTLGLSMTLWKTSFKRVSGLSIMPGAGPLLENREFPTRDVWERLPWNTGPPQFTLTLKYLDRDMRIMEDESGALYIYARPLVSQPEEGM